MENKQLNRGEKIILKQDLKRIGTNKYLSIYGPDLVDPSFRRKTE
jgi:hypothetical protein